MSVYSLFLCAVVINMVVRAGAQSPVQSVACGQAAKSHNTHMRDKELEHTDNKKEGEGGMLITGGQKRGMHRMR